MTSSLNPTCIMTSTRKNQVLFTLVMPIWQIQMLNSLLYRKIGIEHMFFIMISIRKCWLIQLLPNCPSIMVVDDVTVISYQPPTFNDDGACYLPNLIVVQLFFNNGGWWYDCYFISTFNIQWWWSMLLTKFSDEVTVR